MSEDVDLTMSMLTLPETLEIGAVWLFALIVLTRGLAAVLKTLWPGGRT